MSDIRVRLAPGYILPTTEAENDGRCLLSDLEPWMCGLPCHGNDGFTGVTDDLVDHW